MSKCYPKETEAFAEELMSLLDTHYAVLDPALRKTLVQVGVWGSIGYTQGVPLGIPYISFTYNRYHIYIIFI